MRKPWASLMVFLLLVPPRPVLGGQEISPPSTTLQQITQEAEDRLKEWDMMDEEEQQVEAKYWWLGLIELAATLALRHDPFTRLAVVKTRETE